MDNRIHVKFILKKRTFLYNHKVKEWLEQIKRVEGFEILDIKAIEAYGIVVEYKFHKNDSFLFQDEVVEEVKSLREHCEEVYHMTYRQ